MSTRRDWRKALGRKRLEVAVIILYMLINGVVLLVNESRAGTYFVLPEKSPLVEIKFDPY
jgi:hypothetical protein